MAEPAPSTPIPRVLNPMEAKTQLEALAPVEAPKQKAKDPRGEEVYAFSLSYTDGAGNVRKGDFENRILSLKERVDIGMRAHLMVGGLPWESIDPDTRWLAMALAHLSTSLVKKPEWFEKQVLTMESRHQRIVEMTYAEVAKHESYFRGPASP